MNRLFSIILPSLLLVGCKISTIEKPTSDTQSFSFISARVKGSAYYTHAPDGRRNLLTKGIPLPQGAIIHTGVDSFVDLCVKDGIKARIMPASTISVEKRKIKGKHTWIIRITKGNLLCVVSDPQCMHTFSVMVNSLLVQPTVPGEYGVSASGVAIVNKGEAVAHELFDTMRDVLLITKEGQVANPNENKILKLSPEQKASVEKDFRDLWQVDCVLVQNGK